MDKCPYCGSDKGVSTKFTGFQYYSWDGEPQGYSDLENENVIAKCVSCNRRISMKRILKQNELER